MKTIVDLSSQPAVVPAAEDRVIPIPQFVFGPARDQDERENLAREYARKAVGVHDDDLVVYH